MNSLPCDYKGMAVGMVVDAAKVAKDKKDLIKHLAEHNKKKTITSYELNKMFPRW